VQFACGCGETSTPPAIHAVRPGLFRFLTIQMLLTLGNIRGIAATLALARRDKAQHGLYRSLDALLQRIAVATDCRK